MNASQRVARNAPARYAKILLIMEHDAGYHGGVLRGLAAYAQLGKRWAFTVFSPTYADARVLIDQQKPDGVVANVLDRAWARDLRARRIPAVNIGHHAEVDLPRVGMDDIDAGRLAARHLMERGFRHFGFFGDRRVPFSRDRQKGFTSALARHGFQCSTCQTYGDGPMHANERRWRQWVTSQKKPAAIFAGNDFFGMMIGEACRDAGVRVPEDVALLSVDNDELLCSLAHPPLSSIVNPAEQVGFRAARLLDRLMRGGREPVRPLLIRPTGIVTRQSSDILAVADADLADAIRFIRENAHRPLSVKELLRQVPISRRSLERRFGELLGRTPLEEIRRVHVERAKELLDKTALATDRVAERSGFTSASDLAKIFRKATGLTPTAFRRKLRFVD